jgi:hypothetical protein
LLVHDCCDSGKSWATKAPVAVWKKTLTSKNNPTATAMFAINLTIILDIISIYRSLPALIGGENSMRFCFWVRSPFFATRIHLKKVDQGSGQDAGR